MHCLYLDTLYYLAGAWLAWVPKIPVLRANSFLQLQHAQNCSLLLLFEQNTILWILYVWSMCSDKNCWGWGWNRNCGCHNVSIFSRPKKNSNTTHFIQGFQSSFTLLPFKLNLLVRLQSSSLSPRVSPCTSLAGLAFISSGNHWLSLPEAIHESSPRFWLKN